MPKRVKLQHHGVLNTYAQCSVCFKIEDDPKQAVKWANQHCKETGHVVAVEHTTHYTVHPDN